MTEDCSFCWYWWNCWPSLFKLCFHCEKNHTFNFLKLLSHAMIIIFLI